MPDSIVRAGGTTFIVTEQSGWKPGDKPPSSEHDYLGWHAWAEVQHKAGLRQVACGGCGRWKYPQELSPDRQRWTARTTAGKKIEVTDPLCLKCAAVDSGGARKP